MDAKTKEETPQYVDTLMSEIPGALHGDHYEFPAALVEENQVIQAADGTWKWANPEAHAAAVARAAAASQERMHKE